MRLVCFFSLCLAKTPFVSAASLPTDDFTLPLFPQSLQAIALGVKLVGCLFVVEVVRHIGRAQCDPAVAVAHTRAVRAEFGQRHQINKD